MPAVVTNRTSHGRRYSDPQLLADVRQAFGNLQKPIEAFREVMLEEARRGGYDAIQRTFVGHWSRLVTGPRREEFLRSARLVSARRLETLATELARRYPGRRVAVHQNTTAVARAFNRTRRSGARAWRLTDADWPMDQYVRSQFFTVLDGWRRRATLTLSAAGDKKKKAVRVGKKAQPSIDPKHRKFAYPFEPGVGVEPEALIKPALDNVVIARGQFYVMAGIRDLMREVDHLAATLESQRHPEIVGWRWVLSSAHDEASSSPDECDRYATADMGHPFGEGVYYDLLLPESHPNCWCNIIPVWATPSQLADPEWEPPLPDEDYASRVKEMVEQFHPMLANV